jgi:glycine cleavage system H protein
VAVPTDRRYSKTHEWFKVEGNVVTVGISEFAANQLTDITYVQLPAKGAKTKAGGEFGEVESVKATSPLYAAVAGEVVETNAKLNDAPETVNQDAFGAGWMIKIKATDLGPLNALMDAKAYEEFLASGEH